MIHTFCFNFHDSSSYIKIICQVYWGKQGDWYADKTSKTLLVSSRLDLLLS